MAKKSKKLSTAQKVGLGVGLTTAAVTAAGAYFLYGSKQAAKNRKKVQSWALKAKAEVLETLEKAEHITEEEYNALVDGVAKTYGKVKSLSRKDIDEFQKEMRDNWKHIAKDGMTAAKKAVKVVKKATQKTPAKKTTKKAAKKTTKKTTKKTPAKKAAKKTTKKTK